MLDNHTEEDYHEMKKANETLQKEKKNLEAKLASMSKDNDEKIAALQDKVETHEKNEKERQAADEEHNKKERLKSQQRLHKRW